MNQSNLKHLATTLHAVTTICQIALPVIIVLVLVALAFDTHVFRLPEGSVASGPFLWLGVAVGLLPAAALFWALDLLRRLFRHYKDGDVLTESAAILIRQIGKAMLLLALLKFAIHPLQTILLTWQSPPGSRMVSIAIGQSEVGFLLLAGLLTMIGWAMTEAARIAEENRSFV